VELNVKLNMSHRNCHFIQMYPFSCYAVTFQEMFVTQIFMYSKIAELMLQLLPAFPAHTIAL
jgi:hypothetical protein